MKAKDFLLKNLENDATIYTGYINREAISSIADAWMNDESNSEHRFEVIRKFFPEAYTILDMASGCGTCVFYGLLNGYNMYGIDPEKWKHTFNKLKAEEKGYPVEWLSRFYIGVGEDLPFTDDFFDCCTSYQTLEHVMNPKKCILDMLRITKAGGGIHIMCPDYRSTYEGHYNLPWLPLLPRFFAKIYLKALGRPFKCLNTIKYVTTNRILQWLDDISKEKNWHLEIINVNKCKFYNAVKKRNLPIVPGSYFYYQAFKFLKNLFRNELQTNLVVRIINK